MRKLEFVVTGGFGKGKGKGVEVVAECWRRGGGKPLVSSRGTLQPRVEGGGQRGQLQPP